jgi:rRNA-processing protein FCF1
VKQKVSGQFKTGQYAFCILRSVIDTCIKNKVDVFETLKRIAQMPLPIIVPVTIVTPAV